MGEDGGKSESDKSQDVQGTASQAQDSYDYLLESGDYKNYTSGWMAVPESYSILDINQDQIPELMIHSASDDYGWSNTLLFAYDSETQEAKMVQDIYHYLDVQYSNKYKAIAFSEMRSAIMYGGQDFYTLDGTELTCAFSVGWESTGTADNIEYYYFCDDVRTVITEAQSKAYFDELTDIEKTRFRML